MSFELDSHPYLVRLPDSWRVMKFDDLLDGGTRNGVYKPKEFHGRGAKIVNMGELFAHSRLGDISMKRVELTAAEISKSNLQAGDLLFARRSLVAEGAGKCSIVCEVKESTTFESSIIRARPSRGKADSHYLYYLFSSPIGKQLLGTILRQVAVSGITGTDLVGLPIPVPPLSEQKEIARILAALDEKIELNRKTNETLEAIAKALFKSWFVDFDPVRAKAEGRPTGLPDDISDLFPDSFIETEVEEAPYGWQVVTLGSLTSVDKGVSYKGEFLSESEGLPMLNLGCFGGGGTFREEKVKFYNGDHKERHVVSVGDLLIANTDMTQNRVILGSPIVVDEWRGHRKFLFSHHVFALRLDDQEPSFTRYIYHSLLRPEFRQIAAGHATGTTVLALPKDGVTDYTMFLPPRSLIERFGELVIPIYERIASSRKEIDTLVALRDALLPKLISGELRVPDAKAALQTVGA